MTIEQAKQLRWGDTVFHKSALNADGTPMRFRVTGKPKTWKRSPNRVKVPVKRGLYEYGYITETNVEEFTL